MTSKLKKPSRRDLFEDAIYLMINSTNKKSIHQQENILKEHRLRKVHDSVIYMIKHNLPVFKSGLVYENLVGKVPNTVYSVTSVMKNYLFF